MQMRRAVSLDNGDAGPTRARKRGYTPSLRYLLGVTARLYLYETGEFGMPVEELEEEMAVLEEFLCRLDDIRTESTDSESGVTNE